MYDQRFDKANSNLWESESQRLMWNRIGGLQKPPTPKHNGQVDCLDHQEERLIAAGGTFQQDRMITDKRRSLDRAVLYSYQGALVKKYDSAYSQEEWEHVEPCRALMNPNKLKADYDEKIISVGFEYGFQPGDVFEWCNTGTMWIAYLQDLDELAYFRANVRKCCYQIAWDDDGVRKSTYVAVRGPVETKINWIKEHSTILDRPNYSLSIIMPRNEDTLKQFHRYSKFFLQDADDPVYKTCWQVQVVDAISAPGIMEVVALEYYANPTEDDIEAGIVGALIEEPENPNAESEEQIIFIVGETYIKPKKEYLYTIGGNIKGEWKVKGRVPVKLTPITDDNGYPAVQVKWDSTYSGEFELIYGNYSKTIVVESLF